eukprot:scaffold52577_cov18-Tisochrysis_lutea.AAC.2
MAMPTCITWACQENAQQLQLKRNASVTHLCWGVLSGVPPSQICSPPNCVQPSKVCSAPQTVFSPHTPGVAPCCCWGGCAAAAASWSVAMGWSSSLRAAM